MAIKKTSRRTISAGRTPVGASTSITSNAVNRQVPRQRVTAAAEIARNLSPERRNFLRQIRSNMQKSANVMAATNTTNIFARPDFLELLPMFVQNLLVLDVFGSVAMRSRQQLIPYFKFIAENTKGDTKAGQVLSSPFVNRLGMDPNFGGRAVKNEILGNVGENLAAAYLPVLPGSVTVSATISSNATKLVDDAAGNLKDSSGENVGYIDYSTGAVHLDSADASTEVKMTYQYDNENVGPHIEGNLEHGQYGAYMGKGYLQLDEINLVAEAHQLACYWSIYSAFAANTEYGANIGDIAKEAAFAELTAEINTQAFEALRKAASINPQYNWDASPVMGGSVVPSDYLNMLKLKLGQAAASVYQRTRLARPNKLIAGSNAVEYISMINGFQGVDHSDAVGPYKAGTLDGMDVFVAPDYDPNQWVLATHSADIRRCSALFGEYMPLTATDPIALGDASAQQGYATMYGMKVVNKDSLVSGRIVGGF